MTNAPMTNAQTAAIHHLHRALVGCDRLAAAQYLQQLPASALALQDWVNLSRRLHAQSWPELALQANAQALLLAPAQPVVLANHGLILRHAGQLDAARDYLARALALDPGQGEAQLCYAELLDADQAAGHLPGVQALLADRAPAAEDRIALHYACARLQETLGDGAAMMDSLHRGAALKRASFSYAVERDEQMLAALAAQPWPAPVPVAEPLACRPLFIVGLPRTGTSLLESRLAACTGVTAGGELPCLNDAIVQQYRAQVGRAPAGPEEFVTQAFRLDMAAIRQRYLAATKALQQGQWFTDKLPLNALNLPLIRAAFPEAQIVHLSRDPRAMGLALYKQLFGRVYPYSYDLVELGRYVRAYQRLMDHWQPQTHQTGSAQVHWLRYETLVSHWDQQFGALCAQLDLTPGSAAAPAHFAATASASQIRAPVHRRNIDNWQALRQPLAPYLDQLDQLAP